MDPTRWRQIDQLLDEALELPEAEREAFVELRSDGDEELKKSVLDLLKAQREADDFLQDSAIRVMAKEIARERPKEELNSLINQKIGKYRIEKLIGQGGMGDVYLAFDEKMKRTIALKILPPDYVSNDERLRRFEIEAQAIASLNHPNIVTIYDVGEADGINFIATEFVDGKTLRDLQGGRFRLRNVMANSIQICDALSAAHQAGIIHRDIKPENIMIRRDGYAKILDFGLAKLSEESGAEFSNTSRSIIIGTPAYMSPAQINGDDVDHRTDLFSCGVVLYEFVTGKNPFKGKNRQATFQAILTEKPAAPSSLNPELPEELDHILLKLLNKDPDLGYQTASDLRADLRRIKRELDSSPSWSASGQSISASILAKSKSSSRWSSIAVGVVFLMIAGGAAWAIFFRGPALPKGVDWSKARSAQLTELAGTEYYPSLSPDGSIMVYASDATGDMNIYWQRVDGKTPTNLTPDSPGSDTMPAFSPKGDLIAFRSERQSGPGIYVMGATGENPRRICDFGYHPSWSPDGKEIVVSLTGLDAPNVHVGNEHGLFGVDVKSGSKRLLIDAEASLPAWSPNGKRIAYWFYAPGAGRRDVATIPAAGGDPIILTGDFGVSNWNPVWSPDGKFLYFVSDKSGNPNFWRIPIDPDTGKPLSEPEPSLSPSKYSRHLAFSRDEKRMVYVQTDARSNIQAVELDQKTGAVKGKPFWVTTGDREISRAELSADGSKFVMRQIRRTQDDVVTVNRNGSGWRDITNDSPFDRYPRWSPDGARIAFSSDREGEYQIWMSNADGTGLRQITYPFNGETSLSFAIWSPDGKRLGFKGDASSYVIDLEKPWTEQTPFRLPDTEDGEYLISWDWSPDGKKIAGAIMGKSSRWLGYYSFDTRKVEKVIETNAEIPSWCPDSEHFLYTLDNKVFVVDINTKKSVELLSLPDDTPLSPFISRDGKLLYYVIRSSESNIWLLDNQN